MHIRRAAAATLALCLHGFPLGGQPRPSVPVLIGGEESSEGCGGTAVVSVRLGSTLNLRSGPGTSHAIIALLPRGQNVSVCQRGDKGWVGIVVNRTGEGRRDCGLSDAGPKPTPYKGPCTAGWVSEKYLRVSAD